ncbi:ubiquitin carboxyl-terminal hydrolase 47-like isoform X4 [Ctenopharyngodon idella]|uniref:ubiquitin carboxyl-terminal hydrolase 47-like isoform X4 n=1 Tax=Ctenopharyngodon idella TaxID=7959 RepID=UPI0022329889|nr:ubiquitin carboxyl-terminal hydrolase 47-like isoform X4 [Ctenopharyngodon idella]
MSKCQGYCWLENQKSTCYLNAVLQTLFMTKEFRQHVERVSSDDNFIRELKKLFNELEKKQKNAVSAAGVTRSLGITDVYKEQDAAEHLQLILKKTPRSSELFMGETKTTMTWSCYKHEQGNLEPFLSLPISFKHSQDVEVALKAHFDQICGVYLLRCCHCESTSCEKKSEMITFPNLLIIQLRRSGDKEVLIRPQIEVSSHTYELYAIVNHKSTDRNGHYYADIKCEDGIWRRFDDDGVSETPSDERPTLRSSKAHLLVYRRRE